MVEAGETFNLIFHIKFKTSTIQLTSEETENVVCFYTVIIDYESWYAVFS